MHRLVRRGAHQGSVGRREQLFGSDGSTSRDQHLGIDAAKRLAQSAQDRRPSGFPVLAAGSTEKTRLGRNHRLLGSFRRTRGEFISLQQ
jgi:hypothetical protein